MLTACLFVLAGLWTVPVAAHEHTCYDNVTSCIMDLRQMLTSTDKFWFGSSYSLDCPEPAAPGCVNPDPTRLSVFSRLLNLRDTTDSAQLAQKTQGVSLANVTFNVPAGHLYACGHSYQVPAVTNHLIDPLHVTGVSSWSLSHIPTVTWDSETPDTHYTVLVWDVGYYYLHGLYINCVNGTMDTGLAVDVYHEPRNPFLRGNAFIFAAYKQKSALDITAVLQFVRNNTAMNMLRFQPWSFTSTFVANLEDSPAFVNLMTTVADKYSMKQQRDMFIINNCPYLISQLPAFHTVMLVTKVSAMWSDNMTSSSLDMMETSYLTTLSVNMDVEYSTEDYTVESCCTQYSLTHGKFQPDPFSSSAERPGMARNTPRVHLSPMNIMDRTGIAGETYTLFLLDVASALVAGAVDPVFITHWLVTNIHNADVTTGDELAEYFGPNPFTPNAPRAYMFLLYKQPTSMLNNSVLSEVCPSGYQRCRLHLKTLLDAWDLHELVGVTWFLAEQDGFARQRIYNVLNARTKDEVCTGLTGYANPCPADCSNSAPSWKLHRLSLSVLILVLGALFKCLTTF